MKIKKLEYQQAEWFTLTDTEWNPGGVFTIPSWWALAKWPHDLFSLDLDEDMKERVLFGYIYAAPASDQLCYFECDIIFYRERSKVLTLPFNLYWKGSSNQGTVITTRLTTLTSGGSLLNGSEILNVQKPVTNAAVANSSESQGIALHPFPVPFLSDTVKVTLNRSDNFSPTTGIRVVLLSKAFK